MKQMASTSFAVLDSKQRMKEREARRAENAAKDLEASLARLAKKERDSIDDRVGRAVERLRGANVSTAINIIGACHSRDRDVYLLAEEITLNRKSVLQRFPDVRKSIRLAYFGSEEEAVSSAADSDETPEAGEAPTAEQKEDVE